MESHLIWKNRVEKFCEAAFKYFNNTDMVNVGNDEKEIPKDEENCNLMSSSCERENFAKGP